MLEPLELPMQFASLRPLSLLLILGLGVACNVEGPGKGTGSTGDGHVDEEEDEGSLSLTLSAMQAESVGVDNMITATVDAVDAEGNPLDGDVVLTVDPAEGASVSGSVITFSKDGLYTVTASLEGTSLSASEGPVEVDSNGPLIELGGPVRGSWTTDSRVTVEGTIADLVTGVEQLLLNGSPVTVETDGSFSAEMDLVVGTNAILLEAVDADGNESDLVAAIVSGETLALGETLAGGLDVRVNQEGLDAMTAGMGDLLDPRAIEDSLVAANPLVDTAIDCLGVEVHATSFDSGAIGVGVVSLEGALQLDVTVADLELFFRSDVELIPCGFSSNTSTAGSITADMATVHATTLITVPAPGDVEVEVTEVTVEFTSFSSNFGGLTSLLSAFGLTLADLGLDVEAMVAAQIEAVIREQVPLLLETSLEAVAISESFDLLGATAWLDAEISSLVADAAGITLVLDADVANEGSHAEIPANPGSVLQGGAPPVHPATPGLRFALSADTFNRLLHVAWDSGVFNMHIGNDEIGVPASVIELIFPGAETLEIDIRPQLPPIVVPSEDESQMFTMLLGEVQLEIQGEVGGELQHLADVSLLAEAPVDVVLGEDGEISIVVGEAEAWVDLLGPTVDTVHQSEFVEQLLTGQIAGLLGEVLPEIAFPVPELSGFSIEPTGATVEGEARTWMTIEGNLSRIE